HIRGRVQQREEPPNLPPCARLARPERLLQHHAPRGPRRARLAAACAAQGGCRPFFRHRSWSPLIGSVTKRLRSSHCPPCCQHGILPLALPCITRHHGSALSAMVRAGTGPWHAPDSPGCRGKLFMYSLHL